MTWETALAAMERAHPCMCSGMCEAADKATEDWVQRIRLHLSTCPKRKLLDVLLAMRWHIPKEESDG